MPPLPQRSDAPPVIDAIARVAQLEQELAHAREVIAELTRERDELRARVAAPSEPETLEALDSELEVLDALPPLEPPSLEPPPSLPTFEPPSLPPAFEPASWPSIEPPPVSLEPISLSRLVISTPPARPSASEPPPDALAEGDRPSQMDRPSSIERRRRARLGCEFEVEFLGDTHLIAGLSQDISEGGVFVATYQRLVIGSTITLGLELPSGRVEVRGQVRWERGELEDSDQRPGFGVAFTELPAEALAALTEFCRQHPAHYYEM